MHIRRSQEYFEYTLRQWRELQIVMTLLPNIDLKINYAVQIK